MAAPPAGVARVGSRAAPERRGVAAPAAARAETTRRPGRPSTSPPSPRSTSPWTGSVTSSRASSSRRAAALTCVCTSSSVTAPASSATSPRRGRSGDRPSGWSPSRRRTATGPPGRADQGRQPTGHRAPSPRPAPRARGRPTPRPTSRARGRRTRRRAAPRRTVDSPMARPDEWSEPAELGAPAAEPTPNLLQELPPVLKVLGQVVAPATLITALLIFFGWARATALFGWFGIDPTSLGFSSTDYLLTSQDGLFLPGAVIALVVLLLTWGIGFLRRSGRDSVLHAAWVPPTAGVVGTVLATNGVLGLFGEGLWTDHLVVAPVCLLLGVILLTVAGQ